MAELGLAIVKNTTVFPPPAMTTAAAVRRAAGKIAKLQSSGTSSAGKGTLRPSSSASASSSALETISSGANWTLSNTTPKRNLQVVGPGKRPSSSSSSSSSSSLMKTTLRTTTDWMTTSSTTPWSSTIFNNSTTTTNSSYDWLDITANSTNFNETGIESGGGEFEARDYWALILFFFPLLTVFGNVLVILSVYRERTLQTATNYFIISLAIADLLVATLVMPFAVYIMVNGVWGLPAVVCDFYIAMDVTCSTSSIFNLVAISIDRYIAVTQPIKYARHKNHKRVWLTIGLVWAISAAIGSPIVLGLNHTPSRDPTLCMFYNTDFVIYSSLSSFYIPCIIMVFLYYQIFKAIRERAKKQAASRKPANAHLMNTKKLAETALGGTPAPGGNQATQQQQQQQQQLNNKGSSCTTGGIMSSNPITVSSAASALVTVSGVTSAGGATGVPGAGVLTKSGLLGRVQQHSKHHHQKRVVEEDKLTDQGSGSQDEEDDDDREEGDEEESGTQGGRSLGGGRESSNAAQFILNAQMQNDAISKIVLPTVLCNGDTNGNQPVMLASAQTHQSTSGDDVASLLPGCRKSSQRAKGGGNNEATVTNADSGTPPSGSTGGAVAGNGGVAGNSSDKDAKQQASSSRFTIYKVNKASRKKREKSSAKKERKATKTLAIVLAVFLICWVPFFTCNIMDAICTKMVVPECQPGVMTFMLTTWLGYVNSFINPVIYTIFNMEFRKAFKKILVCEK